jgi:hypothetical protein
MMLSFRLLLSTALFAMRRIIQLLNSGLSVRKVADITSTSQPTVARIGAGEGSNSRSPTIGRPRIFDVHDERYITRLGIYWKMYYCR